MQGKGQGRGRGVGRGRGAGPAGRWDRVLGGRLGGRGPLVAGMLALWALGGCGGGVSGEVGRACMASGRDAASPALCSCIQGVANGTLSLGEQRRAASFFGDPQAAQQVRQSGRPGDDRFWDRYRAFADRSEALCG